MTPEVSLSGLVRNEWEEIAPLYAEHIGNTGDEVHQLLYDPAMQSILGDVQGQVVVDAGCGNGYWVRKLEGAQRIIGIDVAPTLIIEARAMNMLPNTEYYIGDLEEELPISDASADIVMSNLALHYLASLDKTASEFSRVLRKNGRALIGVEHPMINAHYRSLDQAGQKPPELDESVGYFDRRYTRRTILGKPIHRFNRPLQDYFTPFFGNGFSLTNFLETQITDQMLVAHPTYERIKDIPRFAVMEFSKN